jgi:uncharacterized protein YceK
MSSSPLTTLRAAVLATAAFLAAGCGGALTEAPARPLAGGTYRYQATFVEDDNAGIARGTVILQDGAGGAVGGTFLLPAQCVARDGRTADCAGAVVGRLAADGAVEFDFEQFGMHHSGLVDRDGTLRGLWVLTLPADSAGLPERRLSGRFEAVPVR